MGGKMQGMDSFASQENYPTNTGTRREARGVSTKRWNAKEGKTEGGSGSTSTRAKGSRRAARRNDGPSEGDTR